MFIAKSLLLASLVVTASALFTPHAGRSVHHHAIAARVAPSPDAIIPSPVVHVTPRKRAPAKRCQARPSESSSSLLSPSPSAPTPAPPPSPVNNAGAKPPKKDPSPVPSPADVAPPPPPSPSPSPPPVQAAPPPSSPPPPSPHGDVHTGDGTFYDAGLGACGLVNSNSDFIAAIGHEAFDTYPGYDGQNPNNNPICGKWVTAHYQGKSVSVQITDRCGGCDIPYSLDFTPTAFQQLADPSAGRIHGVEWSYN